MDNLFTIDLVSSAKYSKENSLFLSFLIPSFMYENYFSMLKNEHHRATHFIKASRIIDASKIIESSSDDKEPKGSAGVPVLNALRGNNLVNCHVVVIRYFGGKLLGVGGLMRAYSKASLDSIANAKLIRFENTIEKEIEIPIKKINFAKYLCRSMGIEIVSFNFMLFCVIIKVKSDSLKIENFISLIHKN